MRSAIGGTADISDRAARDLGFVREFWYNEIRAGRAFAGGSRSAGSVGNLSEIQLFNPAASGVNALIFNHGVIVETADEVFLRTFNTGITSLELQGRNLRSGDAAALAAIRQANPAGAQGTQILRMRLAANDPYPPFVLPSFELGQGEGLLWETGSANIALSAWFLWVELAI